MNSHKELTSYRKCGYEGVDELLWVSSDKGAYGNEKDGPLLDWISDSKDFMSKVKKFDVVVQAGGNCGMYPRFYKNYFKEVYTFEPDDLNFYCLDINCHGEGYHKVKGGLGDSIDKLKLRQGRPTNVGTHKIKSEPGNIQMYRIDDIDLQQCDLIHLDIEGYEDKALRGAENTIDKFKPVIITERAGGAQYLSTLGYKKHKKLRMDTVFIHNSHE
jgi:FkbM family methyltransferase